MAAPTWVLGLNAPPLGWHDPAACLVSGDGAVWSFVEEERVTRVKHGLRSYPRRAAQACLAAAGITPRDVDVVAVGWDLPRLAARSDMNELDPPLPGRPWMFDDNREFLSACLGWDVDALRHPELVFVPHHLAHACAAFHASGFSNATVLVVDGNGEEESISVYEAGPGRLPVRRERVPLPSSLGYLYGAVSELIGLSFLEAGKTMGLAAYGRAGGVEPWPVFEVRGDAFTPPFELPNSATWDGISAAWRRHFAAQGFTGVRRSAGELDRDEMAVRLAWSAQSSLQEVMDMLARRSRSLVGHEALCIAGGVALNCSANGLLPPPVYVPPVPHDAGVALGAAWSIAAPAPGGRTLSPYLGRALERAEVDATLAGAGGEARPASPREIASRLAAGERGAVVTGRAEIGPRALSHRSIIASATRAGMRDDLNRRKGREPWRPLGPVGLPVCEGRYWTEGRLLHQYMVGACQVTDLGCRELPAIVHVDGTARPQAISPDAGIVADVLRELESVGEVPALVNTSFNVRGEPIVDDAAGALRSAVAMRLDFLVLEDRLVDLTRA